jgi:hypothetical protein
VNASSLSTKTIFLFPTVTYPRGKAHSESSPVEKIQITEAKINGPVTKKKNGVNKQALRHFHVTIVAVEKQ